MVAVLRALICVYLQVIKMYCCKSLHSRLYSCLYDGSRLWSVCASRSITRHLLRHSCLALRASLRHASNPEFQTQHYVQRRVANGYQVERRPQAHTSTMMFRLQPTAPFLAYQVRHALPACPCPSYNRLGDRQREASNTRNESYQSPKWRRYSHSSNAHSDGERKSDKLHDGLVEVEDIGPNEVIRWLAYNERRIAATSLIVTH